MGVGVAVAPSWEKKGKTAWVSRAAVFKRSDSDESSRISPSSHRKDLGSNFSTTCTISFTKQISLRTLSVTQTRIPMPTKIATGFMLDSSLQGFDSKSPVSTAQVGWCGNIVSKAETLTVWRHCKTTVLG